MSTPKPNATVAELLAFYDRRGPVWRIGPGRRPALIVIDFSRAFTQDESPFPGSSFDAEIAATIRLLDGARSHGLPVIFTTIAYDSPERDAGFWRVKIPWLERCRVDSSLVAIDPRLRRTADEHVLVKYHPSSFFQTDLESRLRAADVDTLIIAGCTTSVCVRATTIDAMQRGFRPLVAAEAVGDFDASLHAVHLRDLDARYADVMSVEALMAYLETFPPLTA